MKKLKKCIGSVLSGFICLLLLIPLCIFVIFYLPYEFVKYRRSAFFRDIGAKYSPFITLTENYKAYVLIEKKDLPVTFFRGRSPEPYSGYFVYRDILLIFDEILFWCEEADEWMLMSPQDDGLDEFVSAPFLRDVHLEEANEFFGESRCRRAVFLLDADKLEKEELGKATETDYIFPFTPETLADILHEL